jgi:hypothetical protein
VTVRRFWVEWDEETREHEVRHYDPEYDTHVITPLTFRQARNEIIEAHREVIAHARAQIKQLQALSEEDVVREGLHGRTACD